MLTTVEAEIDVKGNVTFLEPLQLTKTTRAFVTILEDKISNNLDKGNGNNILAFLQNNRLPQHLLPTTDEIEAQIKEIRDSWD